MQQSESLANFYSKRKCHFIYIQMQTWMPKVFDKPLIGN